MNKLPRYDVLGKCIKDILFIIKPADADTEKRLFTIQELENSIQSVATLRGAVVKPFGSFVSNLYSKSGDLDVSVQLSTSSNLLVTKKKKQNFLREIMRTLRRRGVTGNFQFIPQARVPVLQYVSSRFGISCDLSIDNYSGRIKSKIFYWIHTIDERFGDMVLLIKEWAKAQNINDPKSGTMNSYSLCLLVLFHFQTCKPAILPPLKDIYEGNIAGEPTFYNEEDLDEVCSANIARFKSQNKGRRNESSLCCLLATFFHKFSRIDALPSYVISTYTGQIERIQDNPNRTAKSYSLFVEDPIERPDNAARAVGANGLFKISSAFNDADCKFVSLEHTDRNDLLALLCTPGVGSELGVRVIAKPYTNTSLKSLRHDRSVGRVEHVTAKPSDKQHHHRARGFTESKSVHNSQVYPAGHQQNLRTDTGHQQNRRIDTGRVQNGNTAKTYQNRSYQQVYTTGHRTMGLYQSDNHPLVQNHNHAQSHAAWVPKAGPYQNHSHHIPQYYPSGHQTAGLYQNYPLMHTNSLQTSGQYQYNNQSQLSATLLHAEVSLQNQQGTKYIPGSEASRNVVIARHDPALGGFNNVPAWDSRYQASSSNTTRQRVLPTASTNQYRRY